MMRSSLYRLVFAAGLWLGGWCLVSAQAQVPDVADVRVEHLGPGTLDPESVLSFIRLQPGDAYDPVVINEDVLALQATERFTAVNAQLEINADGSADLIYLIRSKPRLRSVQVEGGDHFSNRRIRTLLELQIGQPVDDRTVAVRAQALKEEYRERYFLEPEVTWTLAIDEEQGGADLRVTVDEGPRAGIWRIRFEGNEALSSGALRRAMQQGGWRPWSLLTKGNLYDPYLLEADRDAVRRAYLREGFLDVRVGEPRIESGPGKLLTVVVPVEEGARYRVRSITVSGVTLFPEAEVRGAIALRSGDTASLDAIDAARQAIRDFYGSRGYIRTRPVLRLDPDAAQALVDVSFDVQEGVLSYVRDIRIRGNTITKDKVIRRELALMPGDIFDEVRVRRSENRLRNMGYFDVVRSIPTPTAEADTYDLVFDVEEGRTGMLSAGVGFSSIDRALGFVELTQSNFDLFGWPWFRGGGQKMQLMSQFGSRRNDVTLSFVEPWFLDRALTLDVSLFRRENRTFSDDYEQDNLGFEVGLAQPFGRFSRVRLAYSLEQIEITDVADDVSEVIKAEEGSRIKSAATLTVTRDTRDQFFVPTRGNRTVVSGQLAGGVFGGDTDIYSLELRTSQYVPLWFRHVFSLRGAIGVVDYYGDSERVPIFDRRFMGGPRDVRGFQYRDVGPKDDQGDAIGGSSSAFISAEYTMPVIPQIRFALFYDVGQVWEEAYTFRTADINSAYGIGLRFDLPAFPLRFDYAWPVETDTFNDRDSGRFSFFIGHVF
jgi:outer membrane protein insertion porin family